MRAPKIGILTLVTAGLVLAGCSTGDDGDSTAPQPSVGGAEASPDDSPDDSDSEEPTDDDGDDDGAASGDLVAWAGSFCQAVAPLQEEFTGEGFQPTAPADPNDPGAMVDQLRETFGALGPVFEDARSAVESVGPPPIDDGEAVYDNMLNVLSTASDAFGQIDDQLADLDPNDPAALESLTPLFAEIGAELEAAGTELDAAFSRPEMTAAFEAAPECEGLDIAQ